MGGKIEQIDDVEDGLESDTLDQELDFLDEDEWRHKNFFFSCFFY